MESAGSMSPKGRAEVAFLFLGEMLLVPHLWPIVDALARANPELRIDLWISTSAHEGLIGGWLGAAHANVRLRRAPGFAQLPPCDQGMNPVLPPKLRMLARLAPLLWRTRVTVCAEQTSLWLPRVVPGLSRFIFTAHGAGAPNYNRDGRLRCAHRLFFPTRLHMAEHLAHGIAPDRVVATGYAKSSFPPSLVASDVFRSERPILLYAPHWQRYRSSWWDWGRQIVAMLADQDRFNVILAPHQRLFERDHDAAAVLGAFAGLDHVHVDTGSFAMVDGSYTRMADLYIGDSSSQIVEFATRPRTAVLLNSPGMSWKTPEECGYWGCGETVTDLGALAGALERAPGLHAGYAAHQERLACEELGDTSDAAPRRAAAEIVAALRR